MSRIDTDSEQNLPLRPAHIVMDLNRLGMLHPYRLSFMRSLVRRMQKQNWLIKEISLDLDDEGHGCAIYEIDAPNHVFTFVAFTKYLDPAVRSDRVIAEDWDMTLTLCEGKVDDERLEMLRRNVPLQERGRLDARNITLSRANKSSRNFENVVEAISAGQQPDIKTIASIGYLYRTTAVYGSGKFGMADWKKVRTHYPDLAYPFSAEMLTCFMVRHLSFKLADHIAQRRKPETAVKLDKNIKRYLGIGNATGLGMAPYLIKHPKLIARWIRVRETALSRAYYCEEPVAKRLPQLLVLMRRAIQHLSEIDTANTEQNQLNASVKDELTSMAKVLEEQKEPYVSWQTLLTMTDEKLSSGAQELLNSLVIELFPDLVDNLEDMLTIDEVYDLDPSMSVHILKNIMEQRYDWALEYDFTIPPAQGVFWYRSEEKMEPRLGDRNMEDGADREMFMGIGRAVQTSHRDLTEFSYLNDNACVADFILAYPEHRKIVRRVQAMSTTHYGDIRANLLSEDVMPIHLLRCKLSFFGVSKFDPRSRLWVRNTMFQGAPLASDIGKDMTDDWSFPVMPKSAS